MIGVDIDPREIDNLQRELGATSKQVEQARRRAMTRTASTLRRTVNQELRSALDVRTAAALRRRLRPRGVKGGGRSSRTSIWIGMNNMALRDIKGRPRRAGGGMEVGGTRFERAFQARMPTQSKRRVWQRRGSARLPIQEPTVPVQDEMQAAIDSRVMPEASEIFMRHFMTDLRGRIARDRG